MTLLTSTPLNLAKTIAAASLLASTLLSFNAQAEHHVMQAKDISISNPVVREVPPNAMATGSFMTFKNNSAKKITLIKASSNAANRVELHTHKNENGMMRMRQVPNIIIPANGETKLQLGGLHIMLMDLQQSIQKGQTISITLTFEDGSEKTIGVPVKSMMMPKMDHSHHHH